MFTGIVTAVGAVAAMPDAAPCRIAVPRGWLDGAAVGDSVAVDGACLTITSLTADGFECDISPETRAICAPLAQGARVNLELPLRANGRLGGHIVTGHIDGAARIAKREATAHGGVNLTVDAPPALDALIVQKGSVALAGVSLTVNRTEGGQFEVYILPYTLGATTLGDYSDGAPINLETDILARHVQKLLEYQG